MSASPTPARDARDAADDADANPPAVDASTSPIARARDDDEGNASEWDAFVQRYAPSTVSYTHLTLPTKA